MNFTPVSSSDIVAVATDRNDLVIKLSIDGTFRLKDNMHLNF